MHHPSLSYVAMATRPYQWPRDNCCGHRDYMHDGLHCLGLCGHLHTDPHDACHNQQRGQEDYPFPLGTHFICDYQGEFDEAGRLCA